jgi:hypothetical protein
LVDAEFSAYVGSHAGGKKKQGPSTPNSFTS